MTPELRQLILDHDFLVTEVERLRQENQRLKRLLIECEDTIEYWEDTFDAYQKHNDLRKRILAAVEATTDDMS